MVTSAFLQRKIRNESADLNTIIIVYIIIFEASHTDCHFIELHLTSLKIVRGERTSHSPK